MGSTASASWLVWALGSAGFAATTAIFAKIGVEGIDSDLATLFRTLVIVAVLTILLAVTGKFQPLDAISPRSWLFLALSGLATGASWICYFRALKIGDAARDVQARIHQLVTNEATLEEAFLDATGLAEEFKGGGDR